MSGDQPEIAPYAQGFRAVLEGLPAHTIRTVACHAEVVASVEDWLEEMELGDRSEVLPLEDGRRFTVWAQDTCVVQTRRAGETRLLTPSSFPRMDDAWVLAQAAEGLSLPTASTDLFFQGGNVLVGDDFWLLGTDALLQTLKQGPHRDEGAVLRDFAELFDHRRRLILVGTDLSVPSAMSRPTPVEVASDGEAWEELIHTGSPSGTRQPLFDLDTFLSLAGRRPDGRYRILVGDPRLAAEIAGTPLPVHAVPDVFDDVARQLDALGFDVHRNPLPLVHHDDPVLRRRRWYFATANNVLTEATGARARVWLPTYGDADHPELCDVDARNAAIWEDLGFDVQTLPPFHVFARGLGAVRCMCKILDRRLEGWPATLPAPIVSY